MQRHSSTPTVALVGPGSQRSAAPAVAWLAVAPCVAALIFAIVVLGPPLGELLTPSSTPVTWPYDYFKPLPEPVEHARYLIALLGPLLLAGAVLGAFALRRRAGDVRLPWKLLAALTQLVVAGALVYFVLAQRTIEYGPVYSGPLRRIYFTDPTLVATLAIAVAIALALSWPRLLQLLARLLRDTPRRTLFAIGVALLSTLLWQLTSISIERSSEGTNFAVQASMPFWLDETYAVLNGRTPFVDYTAQYSRLWPFLTAATMALFGAGIGVYTTTLAAASAACLMTVFAIFRRVAGSWLAALGLYLPFLATGFFMELGPLENRYGPSNLLTMFPMRYGGPYVLAWLTARHLANARPRQLPVLFVVAGLVVLNNPEFGAPAVGATLAAVLWTQSSWSWRAIARMLGLAALGILGAVALVSTLTLARAGSLPQLDVLLFFPRLYGVTGFGMLPMPTIGFHLAVYATFVAAIGLATVRMLSREEDRVLTAMLVWSGVFGLGVGSYFAGRSHPEVLIDIFSIWSFSLLLLFVAVVRAQAAGGWRRLGAAKLAVLLGVGLAACSIAQTPLPWPQIDRIDRTMKPPFYQRVAEKRFIDRHTKPGEKVAIIINPGHRIAYDVGIVNVAPYVGWESMPLKRQFVETLEVLRREGGRKLFFSGIFEPEAELDRLLARHGLLPGHQANNLTEFIDRGPLGPRS